MSEESVITRFPKEPITEARLIEDLGTLGVSAGTTLVVHSSLSEIGWVCGGAQTVVSSLRSIVRSFGNIVMPTHTSGLCEPSTWENPPVPESWWDTIRSQMPAFDPETTPCQGMGVVPEYFRCLPDVFRSNHPHFSFAASGEKGLEIVSDHRLEFGIGDGTPLSRVYDLDGYVLLVGVDFDRNTSFHLSEYRAAYPGRHVVERFAPIDLDGHRRWKRYRDINIDSSDFSQIGTEFQRAFKQRIHTGLIGNAKSFLFRQRDAVDYAARWMEKNRRSPATESTTFGRPSRE